LITGQWQPFASVLRYRAQIISFGIASGGHASRTPSVPERRLRERPTMDSRHVK